MKPLFLENNFYLTYTFSWKTPFICRPNRTFMGYVDNDVNIHICPCFVRNLPQWFEKSLHQNGHEQLVGYRWRELTQCVISILFNISVKLWKAKDIYYKSSWLRGKYALQKIRAYIVPNLSYYDKNNKGKWGGGQFITLGSLFNIVNTMFFV